MTQVSQPDVTVNILAANILVANTDQKVLFIGQKTAAGSAVAGALNTGIANDNSWDTLFGLKSMLAGMVRDARKLNADVRFDAIALDDAAGTKAEGTITIVGDATADATLKVIVGSKFNHSFSIAITSGDAIADIATAIADAITADTKIPVTAASALGVVTITAVNDGTVGNTIGIKLEDESGFGSAFTIVGMTGGATDPTLTTVFDVIGDERYQTIVWPYDQDLTTVKTFLDARFNTTNDIQDGVAIVSIADTVSNLNTTLTALNSQSLAINVDEQMDIAALKGPAIMEIGYSKSSQIAAIRSLRLQADTDISQFVITRNGARDSFGGPALASKPMFNTPLPRFPLINVGDGFARAEVETLHDNGGFVIGNNTAGNTSIMGEVVTTYKTDSAGNPDISFKYLNYVDTISNIREYYFNNLKSRFAQSRLTEGDLIRGRDMANKELIESFCTQLYTELSGDDFVLTQSGEEALKFFNRKIIVTLDLSTGTVTINMQVPIVTQLRTILATVQIAFSTNG